MKRNIIIFLILVYIQANHAQNSKIPSEKPKLVVGIVIDLMRYDYLFKYWEKYENNGIKRLVNEGSVFKNAHYNYIFNPSTVGFATIATGSNPSVHGIVAESWYAPLSNKEISATITERSSVVGSKTGTLCHSSDNMLVTTFGDEIRLASFKNSSVVSVSLDGASAVISGGHIANAAYWFDFETGTWITTTDYTKELPQWVKDFNDKKLADTYLDRSWETLRPIGEYKESLADDNAYEAGIKSQKTFPYDLKNMSMPVGSSKRNYEYLKYTPFGNNLIKDFAISAMVNERMGQDEYTDYLSVNFSATEYISRQFGLLSVETEDAYLRLDKEIRHFLDFLDTYLGKGNVLVYLTSNHGAAFNPQYMSEVGIPSGVFMQDQSMHLLNSYLSILYGKGDWIKLYRGQQIFLNRDLIENSKLSLPEFQDVVARFCLQFSGVTNVATSTQLQSAAYTSGMFQKMQNSFNQKRSGDIFINLEPGWVDKDNTFAAHNSAYNYDTHVPLIFYGWKINRQTIYEPVDMIDVAPTICTFLDIAFPNGCQGKPLLQLLK